MTADADDRHLVPVRVHVLLFAGRRVLLTRRAAGLAGGGGWQPPGGHLERGETVVDCAVREVGEEVGVRLAAADLRFGHLRQVVDREGRTRIVFLFAAQRWGGEPANLEPDRCDGIGFFPLGTLPRPMVPQLAAALAGYLRGEPFGVSRGPGAANVS